MTPTKATVTFKTKVKTLHDADGTNPQPCIEYKKSIGQSDCNLRPHQHAYYNSDLFQGMLRRAVMKAIDGREWCRISELPSTVTVDTSGFMAVVTIAIEV